MQDRVGRILGDLTGSGQRDHAGSSWKDPRGSDVRITNLSFDGKYEISHGRIPADRESNSKGLCGGMLDDCVTETIEMGESWTIVCRRKGEGALGLEYEHSPEAFRPLGRPLPACH